MLDVIIIVFYLEGYKVGFFFYFILICRGKFLKEIKTYDFYDIGVEGFFKRFVFLVSYKR